MNRVFPIAAGLQSSTSDAAIRGQIHLLPTDLILNPLTIDSRLTHNARMATTSIDMGSLRRLLRQLEQSLGD